jgi:ATP-dependent RNA helicase RhlE
MFMNKEVNRIEFPSEVKESDVKIAAEKEVVKMKNPVQYKKIEAGSAFHEKKDKNKKINLGGPSKRKPPKTKPANRAQAKAKSIAKRKKK